MTLKLLLELKYLDEEEIGYILFHTKNEDELPLLVQKIKNFRSITADKRDAEIEAYKNTEEGKLTLVKAPTSIYYMNLCTSTGLCKKEKVKVNKNKSNKLPAIVLKNENEVRSLLKKFEDISVYDFKDNLFMWKEYFSNPKRLYPPFDIVVKTNSSEEIFVILYKEKENYVAGSNIMSKTKSFVIPIFPEEEYKVKGYDVKTGKNVFEKKVSFSRNDNQFLIDIEDVKQQKAISKEEIVDLIK